MTATMRPQPHDKRRVVWTPPTAPSSTAHVPWFSMAFSIVLLGLTSATSAIGGVFWASGSPDAALGLLLVAVLGLAPLAIWATLVVRRGLGSD